MKHFALNNSEDFRFVGDSAADMRAIREIYLKPFERVVREANPATLMCAYNRINGVLCSENRWLLTDVLRGEWGFSGAVMTDWGAVRDRKKGLEAGLDLEMPGDTAECRRRILEGVADGSLEMDVLDQSAKRVLQLVKTYTAPRPAPPVDFAAHHDLAGSIAADAAVLRCCGEYGQIVTNPPYGERLLEQQEAEELYRMFGTVYRSVPPKWRTLVLTSHPDFEKFFGRKADKKRKLYNGMIKCNLYQFSR